MLRRKLMVRIGVLICAFVVGAAGAVWLLQDVLGEIDRVNAVAAVLIDGVQTMGAAIAGVESARASPEGGIPARDAAGEARALREAMARLGAHAVTRAPDGRAAGAFQAVRSLIPAFLEGGEPGVELHGAVAELARACRAQVAADQVRVARYFRGLVLGLTLAALVMVNVAIFVLLRTAFMVLRPVGALVEGSRELARERFDHRVRVDQPDEFGELAHAYNRLAEQLQANEERKAETLRQLAVSLNHELNNAMAIIEFQLGLLDRQTGGAPAQASRLGDIRASLARMTATVSSLKHIRRVVLTDYAPGQKMIDLERSVSPPDPTVVIRGERTGSGAP